MYLLLHLIAKNATQRIISKLIKDGVVDETRVQYGVTKVFFRTGEMARLRKLVKKKKTDLAKLKDAAKARNKVNKERRKAHSGRVAAQKVAKKAKTEAPKA